MQPILQYRRIGLAIQKQLLEDKEKRAVRTTAAPKETPIVQRLPGLNTQPYAAPSLPPLDNPSSQPLNVESPKEEHAGAEIEESPPVSQTRTRLSERTVLGRALTGILARHRTVPEGCDPRVFVVGWEGKDDLGNPKNRRTAI